MKELTPNQVHARQITQMDQRWAELQSWFDHMAAERAEYLDMLFQTLEMPPAEWLKHATLGLKSDLLLLGRHTLHELLSRHNERAIEGG